ncbi:LysR family transcriptional regulator [Lysinibacillus sp. G4S2]|uniref:LysR family transcriptional regulator n=1 Tax=Lysinibacillus sp. G4S2 TaxID=3055859 RepID=UPI0025A041F8|nr:LysR family transcriptional regulator [Lysinibacillus sp. G4S2]MDM5247740.1 LysR family transcriptional regulator [Lysinibacillus sp. G4S2]
METEWLRTFIVAAKTENFRETAEQRFITQSTVSKHMQHLEKELQATLFERQGKHVKLNHIGAHFLLQAEKMIATIDEGLQNTASFMNGYTSQLTIGVAPQIANSTLPIIIHTFQQQRPAIQITIELLKSNEIGEAVYAGVVDIGLSKLTTTRDIHEVLLAQEPLQLIAPMSKRATDALTLLQQETILTHEYAPYWQDIQQVLQRFPSYKSMNINQTEVIKNFVKHGLGIAFLPKSVIEAEFQQQLLHSYSVQEFSHIVSNTYFLSKYLSADIEAFLAVCHSIY